MSCVDQQKVVCVFASQRNQLHISKWREVLLPWSRSSSDGSVSNFLSCSHLHVILKVVMPTPCHLVLQSCIPTWKKPPMRHLKVQSSNQRNVKPLPSPLMPFQAWITSKSAFIISQRSHPPMLNVILFSQQTKICLQIFSQQSNSQTSATHLSQHHSQ